MEEKLNRLYKESLEELKSIGIDLFNEKSIGKIDIKLSKRNNKRYGCCKQEDPEKSTIYRLNRKIYYRKYNIHHIEISKWVMELNDDLIKNTIIHELIHCIPDCNNHGKQFKLYAKTINSKLGYSISRIGNRQEDYKKSNLEFEDDKKDYKYKIVCSSCGLIYYRKRMTKGFLKKYRCGKCKGKLYLTI